MALWFAGATNAVVGIRCYRCARPARSRCEGLEGCFCCASAWLWFCRDLGSTHLWRWCRCSGQQLAKTFGNGERVTLSLGCVQPQSLLVTCSFWEHLQSSEWKTLEHQIVEPVGRITLQNQCVQDQYWNQFRPDSAVALCRSCCSLNLTRIKWLHAVQGCSGRWKNDTLHHTTRCPHNECQQSSLLTYSKEPSNRDFCVYSLGVVFFDIEIIPWLQLRNMVVQRPNQQKGSRSREWNVRSEHLKWVNHRIDQNLSEL